ncbi:putative integral membrane protein linked to a cation pump [Methylophaga frappieri]|uniref:Putative integral membrane protein linked to a cation pump n=1 Tax=Methylophaga frappieri (strain ATCC BAA-2434 / DSM 25690 / JAM7) TaxID=754477 RepID=I1YFD4_METFJ|nr:FixH family protein [Methylophaga frappieri]AFJ01627.1 putative integral membrane protein linked to a cation pump [Methylophaga frappieri]
MAISQHNPQALKNPWVLGFLGFLVTFLTANAVFIYLAFQQRPNLVVDNFYERGKAYAMKEAAVENEQTLGWNGVIMAPAKTRVNQKQPFEVLIQGKNSTALNLDSVTFFAYRPSDMNADFSIAMNQMAAGRYAADITFSLPGNWDVIVEAKQGEDEFLLTRRIYIDP